MSFELPEDLTALPDEEFTELKATLKSAIADLLKAEPPATAEQLGQAHAAHGAVKAEGTRRAEVASQRDALAAEIAAEIADEPEEDAEEEPVAVAEKAKEPEPVLASRKTRPTFDTPPAKEEPKLVAMTAGSDAVGAVAGTPIASFRDAANILLKRVKAYPESNPGRSTTPKVRTPRGAYEITPSQASVRHAGITFERQFPEELRVRDGQDAGSVIDFASKESRLPGGSLLKSAQAEVDKGRALTAAVGWCAPSETIYDLCELSSLDGLLDLPEVQATRGGFNVVADGGPDFSVLWDGLGTAGDVILTEYDIENDAVKECFEIPCPDFVDVRLDAIYACLTGSLLQRRGFPEVVEKFSRETIITLAHKMNASVIARIVTASGAATVIPADASGDDAASNLLFAVELAAEDIRYRNRMSRATTLEVVLPYWARVPIRAAISRRRGGIRLDVTDAEMLTWFAARGVMPRFVYDWQDAFTGVATGPGGATALTTLPATGQFLIYPAGTFTKIVRDVVNLDTIYDSALLTSNQYTALFVEDGFNVIQTCPISRLYTFQADPSGVTGCCP